MPMSTFQRLVAGVSLTRVSSEMDTDFAVATGLLAHALPRS